MDIKVTCTIAFLTGVAVGVAATLKFTKKKYEQIAQEEIDSVKEVFRRLRGETEVKATEEPEDELADENEDDEANDHVDICEYRKIIKDNSYDNDQNCEEGAPINMDRPYVIAPDEFGERAGYERFSFTYYSDGTLTDECDEPISPEDVEKLVGKESLTHFGEYEDDSVFVRNDDIESDFEILLDLRKYSDVKRHIRNKANE